MCAEIQRANQDAVGRAPSGGFILVNTEASLRSTLTSAGQWKLLIKASGCSYGTADCQAYELGIKRKVKTNTEDSSALSQHASNPPFITARYSENKIMQLSR